jgi:hypothetical protein
VIALPKHAPCGLDGAGELIAGTVHARCDVVIRFRLGTNRADKSKGCGAVSKVCAKCGLRAKWNDGPCLACEKRTT